MPHAIASTSDLVEIVRMEDGKLSENQSRMMLAMAVVRTVNGFVDQGQQGFYAESIYTIAKKMGLPAWVIDLRHDATHNQLPSLTVLRAAAKDILSWLKRMYWDNQSNMLEKLKSVITDATFVVGSPVGIAADRKATTGVSADVGMSALMLPTQDAMHVFAHGDGADDEGDAGHGDEEEDD